MSCENCTITLNETVTVETLTNDQQNCWIVMVVSFMVVVGLFKLFKILVKIISPLSWFPHNLQKRYVPEGIKSWALITGGSEGIGLGFAEELAKRNFNIIIMSRSETKLKHAKDEILKLNPKIEVVYMPVDFSKLSTAEDYEKLMDQLKDYDISILVNNVGLLNTEKFLDNTYQKIRNQTIVNLLPITCLTRLFLPKMIERSKKISKRSAIINVASSSSLTAMECQANYCSSKTYDDMFTRSVAVEYRNEPVDFLSVRPFLVTTPMTREQTSFLHVTANHCAQGSLKDLGRYTVSYGHWWHRIQGALVEQLRGKFQTFLMCIISRDLSKTYREIDQKKK